METRSDGDMIEIPYRLAKRPRDHRGLVIPFTQFIDANGKPDFRVLDRERAARAVRRRLCSICGVQMRGNVFFIGGPRCVENGYFYDPAMHRECAIYAMTTCPHLARSKGRYAPDTTMPSEPGVVLIAGMMDISKKAEWFGLMQAKGYRGGQDMSGMLIIKADMPWVTVEQWRDGQVMELENATFL